jgi:hypothetical protein
MEGIAKLPFRHPLPKLPKAWPATAGPFLAIIAPAGISALADEPKRRSAFAKTGV